MANFQEWINLENSKEVPANPFLGDPYFPTYMYLIPYDDGAPIPTENSEPSEEPMKEEESVASSLPPLPGYTHTHTKCSISSISWRSEYETHNT